MEKPDAHPLLICYFDLFTDDSPKFDVKAFYDPSLFWLMFCGIALRDNTRIKICTVRVLLYGFYIGDVVTFKREYFRLNSAINCCMLSTLYKTAQ